MLGCETCECVDFGQCDSALMSSFCEWPRCDFGYKHDAVGCPQCECAENPCEVNQTLDNESIQRMTKYYMRITSAFYLPKLIIFIFVFYSESRL